MCYSTTTFGNLNQTICKSLYLLTFNDIALELLRIISLFGPDKNN